jgi:hypothetical protein
MIVYASRPAILVCAMFAVSAITLDTPAARAATAIHVCGRYRVLPRVRDRHLDCRFVPRASQVHEHVQDPFALMLLG